MVSEVQVHQRWIFVEIIILQILKVRIWQNAFRHIFNDLIFIINGLRIKLVEVYLYLQFNIMDFFFCKFAIDFDVLTSNDSMTRGGSISMRHPLTAMAANDIHEGGIVQSGLLSLQHTAIHNNYHIPNYR